MEYESLGMGWHDEALVNGNPMISHCWRNLDFICVTATKLVILTFFHPIMSKHLLIGGFPHYGRFLTSSSTR